MNPVYIVFKLVVDQSTYIGSYASFDEANNVVTQLNLSKGADTSFYITNGYSYG